MESFVWIHNITSSKLSEDSKELKRCTTKAGLRNFKVTVYQYHLPFYRCLPVDKFQFVSLISFWKENRMKGGCYGHRGAKRNSGMLHLESINLFYCTITIRPTGGEMLFSRKYKSLAHTDLQQFCLMSAAPFCQP